MMMLLLRLPNICSIMLLLLALPAGVAEPPVPTVVCIWSEKEDGAGNATAGDEEEGPEVVLPVLVLRTAWSSADVVSSLEAENFRAKKDKRTGGRR